MRTAPSFAAFKKTALGAAECIYNGSTNVEPKMRVQIAKWGNSAALRVPAAALADAGLQIGQALDLRVEEGRLVLEPARDNLEDLVARITPQNRHGLVLDDAAVGAEE